MKVSLSKLAGLVAFCAIILALTSSGLAQGGEAERYHTCYNRTNCRNNSGCTGQFYSLNVCAITCYNRSGSQADEVVTVGNASCAGTTAPTPTPPPGGGGGGGGFEGGGGWGGGWGGGYCYENWMWDAGCQGPDDAYEPIHMAYAW